MLLLFSAHDAARVHMVLPSLLCHTSLHPLADPGLGGGVARLLHGLPGLLSEDVPNHIMSAFCTGEMGRSEGRREREQISIESHMHGFGVGDFRGAEVTLV